MKFGGTSVGKGMPQCVEIVKDQAALWDNVVVVTSALTQVTNKLIDSAQKACEGDDEMHRAKAIEIRAQHLKVCQDTLKLPEAETAIAMAAVDGHLKTFTELCHAMAILGEYSLRGADAVSSLGERMSCGVLAAAIRCGAGVPSEAVDAKDVIVTDDNFQDAHPQMTESREKAKTSLVPLLKKGVVPVVTGFLGATASGATTTLGRGGSDYSATIVGALVNAAAVWIWTDVNGIMTADPRIAKDAITIPRLSLREVAEMSYFGAKVVHAKTIRPVVEQGIPLRICNTFEPSNPGTIVKGVVSEDLNKPSKPSRGGYKAVTSINDVKLITVAGRGMLGVMGVAARAFTTVAAAKTSVLLITQGSSEQSICFAVPAKAADGVVASLNAAFASEIATGDVDGASSSEECSIITVVGAEMVRTKGVAGKVFTALGDAEVNVMAIAQGSSEVSISAVVAATDTKKAVVALHGCTTVTPMNSPAVGAKRKRNGSDVDSLPTI